jgi:hypothetical protein
MPSLLIHNEKIRDPIYFLKDTFPCKLHGMKIVPTFEVEIKSIILSFKSKNSSGYDEITSKIQKACASLISQPLSHIYNHWFSLIILKFQ